MNKIANVYMRAILLELSISIKKINRDIAGTSDNYYSRAIESRTSEFSVDASRARTHAHMPLRAAWPPWSVTFMSDKIIRLRPIL